MLICQIQFRQHWTVGSIPTIKIKRKHILDLRLLKLKSRPKPVFEGILYLYVWEPKYLCLDTWDQKCKDFTDNGTGSYLVWFSKSQDPEVSIRCLLDLNISWNLTKWLTECTKYVYKVTIFTPKQWRTSVKLRSLSSWERGTCDSRNSLESGLGLLNVCQSESF